MAGAWAGKGLRVTHGNEKRLFAARKFSGQNFTGRLDLPGKERGGAWISR